MVSKNSRFNVSISTHSPLAVAVLAWFAVSSAVSAAALEAATIGKWRRHVVSVANSSYSGNPFELEVDATFTHIASGTELTLPGYYTGSDTWEIGFMPNQIGEWTWVTSSSDPDLNNKTGSVDCVASGNRGFLKADPIHPRKWRFADGPYVAPVSFRLDPFHDDATLTRFTEVADFLKNSVEGHMMEFSFRNEVFSDWQGHQFDLVLWDRLEARMEILAERGLGIHFMFYADDADKPKWSGQSTTEQLLIRYIVARLAGYPVVVINTGVDIDEYRSQSDIDWLGQQVQTLDPYDHPISSRRGGGSGSIVISGESFMSRGDRFAIINDMTGYFLTSSVPVSMDDAWIENNPGTADPKRSFSEHDIRRALWKCVMAGGLGGLIRGSVSANGDSYFRLADFEEDLESEQFLVLINPFVESQLGELYGQMEPAAGLVSNGYALADPARTKILYFLMGNDDKDDPEPGGPVTLKLGGLAGTYDARWFDPRTGVETNIGAFPGGSDHVLNPPSTDDWVLLLNDGQVSTRSLDVTPPTGGRVISTPTGINCSADCQQDYQYATQVGLTATPDYGSQFDGWAGEPDCWDGQVLMIVDTTCAADFGACILESTVDLPPQQVSSTATFEACNQLNAGTGGFEVLGSADVTFQAGNLITLAAGFSVAAGARFEAQIGEETPVVDPPPSAPIGLAATTGDATVSLDWVNNPEPDLAGYRVHRALTSAGPYTEIAGLLGSSSYIDTAVSNGINYYYVVTAEDSAGNESLNSNQVAATPGTGLVGHWQLDEGGGSVAGDATGSSDGAVFGAAWVAGVSGTALDFDGLDDHVAIANTSVLDITGTEVTLSAWIFPRDAGDSNGSRVISKRTDPGGSDVYALYTQDNRIIFRLDGQDMISTYVFTASQWLHVTVVYDGVDKRIFINGSLDAGPPQVKTDPIDSSARAVHLGMREGENRRFNGSIDQVRIYDRPLNAGEVATLYGGGG